MSENLFNFLKALAVAISTLFIFSLILLPWRVWSDSFHFLSKLSNDQGFIKKYLHSELKVFSWVTLFITCLIFLMYPTGLILIISLFFKGFQFGVIIGKMFFLFMVTYFGPILLTFIKELFSLTLLKYFKLESLDEQLKAMNTN